MSRAVIAIMAGLLCALAGLKYAADIKADASRLSRWVQLLEHLVLLLKEGVMSIPEALCTAADQQSPPDKLLRDIAGRISTTPLLTLAEAYAQCSVSSLETSSLTRMFTRLGRGTKEQRCLAVSQCADEMRLLAQHASAKAEKDARLWQTLGSIGGICLTIMLL